MTDLSAVLHAAAPVPRRELDVADLHRRARRRGLRRLLVWLTGLSAVVVAGFGVTDGFVVTAGKGGGGATRLPDSPTTIPVTMTTAAPGAVVTSGRNASSGGSARTPVRTPDAGTGIAAQPVSADACSVDTRGMTVGGVRQCQFVAASPGGASMTSSGSARSGKATEQIASGRVYVTRNGQRRLAWTSEHCGVDVHAGDGGVFAGSCAERFIAPGDLVDVELTLKRDDPFVVTLGAGKDW
ncbi:MAG: hypothetical protein QOG90_115 [Actinomycetota bacterium]|jgi:hypothetical protein